MQPFIVDQFNGGVTDLYLSCGKNCYAQANNFRIDEDGKLITRNGTKIFGTRVTNASRISGIYLGSNPYGSPIFFATDKAYTLNETDGFTEITGPASNSAIPNKGASNYEASIIWQKQIIYASPPSTVLPHRIYCTAFSPTRTYRALTLGLPALSGTPTLASAGGTGSNYIYTFHYYYTFTDSDGTVYEEKGPIVSATISNVGAPNANNITISNIPTLANTSSTNYDVSTSLKIRVYRTINNGTTSYLLASVNNGTTSYVDSTSDATIALNAVIYTDGGVLDYNPPIAGTYYVTQVNDYFWYATERYLYHSIAGAPGACPDEYQQYVDQKIIGLSSTISFPILFCDRSIYRVDGVFDEFGDGGFDLREISPSAGCISNRSVVRIPSGIVWAGNGGFYYTDGYRVAKISLQLSSTYSTLWASLNVVGCYDALKNVVYWTISSGGNTSSTISDSIAILDLNRPISEKSVLTTMGSDNNVFPNCVAYSESSDVDVRFRSKLLIGESRGYLLYQDETAYTDPKIDTSLSPSSMKKSAIVWRFESAAIDLGDDSTKKYVPELTCEFETITDVALKFYSRRDDGGAWSALSELKSNGVITWDTSEYNWDDTLDSTDPAWDSTPLTEGKRHFPKDSLRSTRRQVAITNSVTYITRSDIKGLATTSISGPVKTVTLDDATKYWPEDCEDYEIAFASDYTAFYKIKDRLSDTQVTVYDPYGTFPTVAGTKWEMRGIRKNERTRLLSYSIWWTPDGATQGPNRGTTGDRNA